MGNRRAGRREIDAAAALSVTPPALNADHLAALDEQGLDTLAQLDLLQSAAFFALGQPPDAYPGRTLA
ncbi:peroxidase [Klebsiella pneumoniae]|uniref:Peroxidase n=1 Tax=Klebsiella pneumoniae TaxID=573 RepID=A0A2X3EXH5_KLEPN|nr:peroxidase [Klebsiella pneumoniae]